MSGNTSKSSQTADAAQHAVSGMGEFAGWATIALLTMVEIILAIGPVFNYWVPLQILL